ncbi:hypothetical protein M9Y10_018619 [Tritrichomonas musculus]|uniref:Leucine-rich repeat domain-containing protein n=1 Tax=Tritrichomonas musculus TaxID=1915356 RepID=A0ABR2HM83_9EUKA
MPSSIVSIGSNAFHLCSLLSKIALPSSLSEIEKYVFSDCVSLTNISVIYIYQTLKISKKTKKLSFQAASPKLEPMRSTSVRY